MAGSNIGGDKNWVGTVAGSAMLPETADVALCQKAANELLCSMAHRTLPAASPPLLLEALPEGAGVQLRLDVALYPEMADIVGGLFFDLVRHGNRMSQHGNKYRVADTSGESNSMFRITLDGSDAMATLIQALNHATALWQKAQQGQSL